MCTHLSDSCPVLQNIQIRQHIDDIGSCPKLRTALWEASKQPKGIQALIYSRQSFYYKCKEQLRKEGYQKPPKAFSSSYLGLERPSSSSSLIPRHSITLTDTQGKLSDRHCV